MPLSHRLYTGDEELAKKYDDHKPRLDKTRFTPQYQRMHTPPRRSLKRAIFIALALGLTFYFFKYLPVTFQQPIFSQSFGILTNNSHTERILEGPAPVGGKTLSPDEFNGPIKFYNLASTLHRESDLGGKDKINKNVLFAAANLQSAATLLPLACEMAQVKLNHVHFVIMGRNNISINALKSVNSIGEECNVKFHDARPDSPTSSSDHRMQASVSSGFKHVNTYINPQATLIDASKTEDVWCLEGIKAVAFDLSRTVIQIPKNAEENMRWITLLDSSSLRAWNEVSLEILVHPQPAASGSLIRLLESLKRADYFSSSPPHLTIELPHDIEEPTSRYLQGFKWPPSFTESQGNMLKLHHRIPQHSLTAEENSIRMLESFWPANPFSSQILILGPQVELSPFFFHYLKYSILKYKFGERRSAHQQRLLGISLDLPSKYLNNTSQFLLPSIEGKNEIKSFLWQAPNSNTCLFFGEKWVELHDFVARSLNSQHTLPTPPSLSKKEVSRAFPSWLEYILQLSRARGYLTLYPKIKEKKSLAIIHNELYRIPEEYKTDFHGDTVEFDGTFNDNSKVMTLEREETLLIKDSFLQDYDELSNLHDLIVLNWEGNKIELKELDELALNYRKLFTREIGGCKDETMKAINEFSAGDLFCLEDENASSLNVKENMAMSSVERVDTYTSIQS